MVSLAATLATTLLCVGCSPQPNTPPAAAKPRVVSLAPALTATVRALGGDEHLVGVTSFCETDGPVAVVGDFSPRPEAVLAQEPDVVLMAGYETQAATASALSALGLEVRTLPLVTLADMRATTLAVARMIRREAAAEALLTAFDRALAEAAPPPGSKPLAVLLVYDVQPGFVFTTGGGDHISELVARLGGANVADGPVTARLGLERVLEADPELILHVAPDQRFPSSREALAYWASWPELAATRRGQAVVFGGDGLARNGPHLAQVIPRLAAILETARRARAR